MAKGNKTGKRYTEAEKNQIMKFIENAGRGGITQAKEKWGVSYVAIKSWKAKGLGGKGVVKKSAKSSGKIPKALVPGKVKGLKGLLTLVNKLKAKLESMA